mgnify:CR=1 FL=1
MSTFFTPVHGERMKNYQIILSLVGVALVGVFLILFYDGYTGFQKMQDRIRAADSNEAAAITLQFVEKLAARDPVESTTFQLQELSKCIAVYKQVHGVFPSKVSDVHHLTLEGNCGFLMRDVDAWQTPIEFTHGDGTFQLASLGSDRKPGGEGLSQDIIISRSIKANE